MLGELIFIVLQQAHVSKNFIFLPNSHTGMKFVIKVHNFDYPNLLAEFILHKAASTVCC